MESSLQGNDRPPDPMTAILMTEKERIDPSLTHVHQVIQEEIDRRSGLREPEYLEVDIPKPMKLSKKILVPFHRNPGFNYIGKLMGPGGSTLKKLQEKHNVKLHVCGRGSSKDKSKEQELYLSGDPKYSHFGENLHVKVDVVAPPVEAFRRMANALDDVKAHFNPDLNDDISKAQIEQGFVPNQTTQSGPINRGRGGVGGRGIGSQRGRAGMFGQRGRGNPSMGRGMGMGRGVGQPPRPPMPGMDYGGCSDDFSGSATSGYYDNSSYSDNYGQQSANMNMMPPSTPMRPPGPRPSFNMPPRMTGPSAVAPPRSTVPMNAMNPRSQAPGPRMMGHNGMPMNAGGKMLSAGQNRGGFRMTPYPGVSRANAPPQMAVNPYT